MGLGFLRSKSQLRVLSIANAVGYISMITFNILSSTRGWNGGETNGSVSNKYDTVITPAAWAFGPIWSVIFAFNGLFVIYQCLPSNLHVIVSRLQFFYFINLVLNALWSVVFDYEVIWLAFVILFLMWASLLVVYLRLFFGVWKSPYEREDDFESHFADVEELRRSSWKEAAKWLFFVDLPISVYLGWITAATLVNWAIQCSKMQAMDSQGWAIVYLLIAQAIACLLFYYRLDFFYGLAIAWALAAVADAQKQHVEPSEAIRVLSIILAVVNLAASLVAMFIRYRRWSSGVRSGQGLLSFSKV